MLPEDAAALVEALLQATRHLDRIATALESKSVDPDCEHKEFKYESETVVRCVKCGKLGQLSTGR